MGLLKTIQSSSITDAELIHAYQKSRQQETLAELYLRYYDLVYGTCCKYLNDQEAAKDAVMDIYHELIEKLKTHSIENFKSWLYVVTKNHCLMQLRKNKKMQTADYDIQFMQSEDFFHLDGVMEKENRLERLGVCIDKLNDEQKKVVNLFYIENKCYNDITLVTGYEWNKVRSLIQNGRRNLKNCLEENE